MLRVAAWIGGSRFDQSFRGEDRKGDEELALCDLAIRERHEKRLRNDRQGRMTARTGAICHVSIIGEAAPRKLRCEMVRVRGCRYALLRGILMDLYFRTRHGRWKLEALLEMRA